MRPGCVTVLFPCHTLDDFPTWLEEPEADELLAAWTAAWHPAIVAATGGPPVWASVDLPQPADVAAGVVPGFCDDRFTAQADPDDPRRWVRKLASSADLTAALAAAVGVGGNEGGPLPASGWAEDFRALGLAALLAELLARRMRTEADLATPDFEAAVAGAARAAVAGDDAAAREGLTEAFACLEATRSRYYAVDSWAIDIVLLAPGSTEVAVRAELESPVPLTLVAEGATLRRLAEKQPAAVAAIRAAVAAGRVEACGGRDDCRPLELCSPEEIAASLAAGRQAWIDHVGAAPTCYAATAGGSSAILPQLLAGFGFRAAIWSLFDGSPLPDPGGGLIRWQGTGGGSIEAVARPPLDAGRSTTILELPDRIGDAFDHDHAAVVAFAHYAGAASQWHGLLRRIAAWSGLFGRFVTPAELVGATAAAGIEASFEPDAFAAAAPAPAAAGHDPVAAVASATRREAATLVAAARDGLSGLLAVAPGGRPAAAAARPSGRPPGWLPAGWLGRRRDDDTLLLDNGLVQLRPHPRSGGLLSLRRPADRGNRLSQQLALRTTRPPDERRWEPPEERAEHTRMEADTISRTGSASAGTIESRGRLVDGAGRVRGRFTQRMELVAGLPLALFEIEVRLEEPVAGPVFEAHLASRFAWHENEDVEVRRSLHLQSIATERTRFTAPHFVELFPEASRAGGAVAILTGGLPWHLRSSPHVLDTILLGGGREVTCRLAVGIGLERPWDMALELAAGGRPTAGWAVPDNVRLTIDPAPAGHAPRSPDQPTLLRAGLVESAGRSGEVRIEWGREVVRAAAIDQLGQPRPDVAVTVAGRSTAVRLDRYQWLALAIEFPPRAADAAGGGA